MERFYNQLILFSFVIVIVLVYLWDVINTVAQRFGVQPMQDDASSRHWLTSGWVLPIVQYFTGTNAGGDGRPQSTGRPREEPRNRRGTPLPHDGGFPVE